MISGLFGGLHYWAVGVNSENNGAMAEGRHILASQETGNVLIKSALADIGETNTVWFEFRRDVRATPEMPTDNLKKLGTEYSRCYYRE